MDIKRILGGAVFAATASFLPLAANASCGWSDINLQNARAAVVSPDRVHFVKHGDSANHCPSDGKECRAKAYLVRGDMVLTGTREGDFVCIGYVTARGDMLLEWLPAASLDTPPADVQNPSDWTGTWRVFDNEITIAPKGDALAVAGDATWRRGDNVHVGDLQGVVKPEHGQLAFTSTGDGALPYAQGGPDDCRIKMVRRGAYLLVEDNDKCGGLNVTFTGFYKRGVNKKP
ncbi:hypothetical protein [Achromobacter aloeverae]|uniref:Uncharacterized protein n=1 Tax=Achromobacter aloeverae TaxID=1750518 RepID=A0A4V1MSM9_9BURK|nr:hypothetical protein [Achromobacter aloeverae]RXN92600.1 hypothetical protein C7R54_02250 [Achromobacter aloeverae]